MQLISPHIELIYLAFLFYFQNWVLYVNKYVVLFVKFVYSRGADGLPCTPLGLNPMHILLYSGG